MRYIFGRTGDRFDKFVSSLSIIGISLGVISLITITNIMNSFEILLEHNILEYIPHIILTTPQGNFNPNKYPIKNIICLYEINHITPIIKSDVVLQNKQNIGIAVMIGINKTSNEPLLNHLQYVNSDILTENSYNIILGKKLSEQLKVKLGDQLRLIIPSVSQLTPIGRIPSQRLVKVVGFFISKSEADNSELLINEQDASKLMNYPIGNITGWRLYLNSPLTVDSLSKKKIFTGMVWHDWREQKGEFFQSVKMEKNIMILLLSLVIIVATFNIVTSLSLLIMEKQPEIAILNTLGLKRSQIMAIFMLHGVLYGIIGTIIGILFGLLITNKINLIMFALNMLTKNIELPIIINPINIILISLLSIFISFLATIYPSWCAANIQPVEALRYE
ncbi:MAG: lipoprotein-releasing ABC transporter permease subunit LolC [Arsenophonus endosymbiont of Ceratovacuna japonica]